ncbi:hypothetical protein MJO28_017542 [Puccinia striiformis f. sp. tritici]|nr:hypothetical protein MJO28_017542 [Puccinia striiformis f. sp. tritici]
MTEVPRGVAVDSTTPALNHEQSLMNTYSSYFPQSIGQCSDVCSACGALHWRDERTGSNKKFVITTFTSCCQKGNVVIPITYSGNNYPDFLKILLTGNNAVCLKFQRQIRAYNNSLAFASLGANADKTVQGHSGIFTFRVSGALFHNLGSIIPAPGEGAKFAQIYTVGGNDSEEANLRTDRSRGGIDSSILLQIQRFLTNNNSYAKFYRTAGERLLQNSSSTFVLKSVALGDLNPHTYNTPRVEEIAMVLDTDDMDVIQPRDVMLSTHGGSTIRITDLFSGYLALRYPIFFPFGEQGWIADAGYASGRGRKISQCEWYASMLFDKRARFSSILNGKTLLQELLVDMYICVERSRLDFMRMNQKQLKANMYKGLAESLQNETDIQGRRVILPSTFPGSPRNMIQLYQDAMAIVREFGPPSFFMTVTANPRWPEILAMLEPHQTPSDRPDLVARVFSLKLASIIDDVVKKNVLGRVVAYVYTVEFQKRGLPHAHVMIMLDPLDIPRTEEAIDSLVCAEIPDLITEPRLHSIVCRTMLHGPCGLKSTCWKNGTCRWNFPKPFVQETRLTDDAYPEYRRRDDGRSFVKSGNTFHNGHVVPYNKFLLLRYDCHINLEIPYSIRAMKYLFKYICKGVDRSSLELLEGDETKAFVEGRYVGPSEAAYRLFQCPMNDRFPAVQRLSLHLDREQVVYYRSAENARIAFNSGRAERTTLTEFFQMCQTDIEGLGRKARDCLYHELPKYFWWTSNKTWSPRVSTSLTTGRVYFAGINEGERYFIRLLLLNRRGPRSFEDLRTVEGIIHHTYREAAEALGLLASDDHYAECLREASVWMVGKGLRAIFCIILTQSNPSVPQRLLDEFITELGDDCKNLLHHNYRRLEATCPVVESLTRFLISVQLRKHEKTFFDVGLDPGDTSLWDQFEALITDNDLAMRSLNQHYRVQISSLNCDQKAVADKIINSLETNPNIKVYIDGPGGTGKTFLLNFLIGHFQDAGLNVISVASSGIAALMLSGGSTAHSRFKIPLKIESGSMCNWDPNSKLAAELCKADIIIWDEISMQNRYAVEAVDRSFQELLGCDKSFGGVAVIFGGDFRQILPVVRGGSLLHQAKMSMLNSQLWSDVVHCRLTYNVRLLGVQSGNPDGEALAYNQWLLSVGEATGQVKFQEEIDLPFGNVFVNRSEVFLKNKIIDFVYRDLVNYSDANNLSSFATFYTARAILSPLNKSVNLLNEQCLHKLPGSVFVSVSSDEMIDLAQNTMPEEVLNTISIPGFPEHKLNLKINMPIVLLRNMCLGDGMCNGTRFMVVSIQRSVLKVRVLTGPAAGQLTGIPRVRLLHDADKDFGISFARSQFPVAPAFAMTINKSQGQSLETVGVFLPRPVFAHGQLYVALSRTTDFRNMCIAIVKQNHRNTASTTNVANIDMLRDHLVN